MREMKRLMLFVGTGVLLWVMVTQSLLSDGTTTLTDRALSVPALSNVDTISKLVVLDSMRKTGLLSRYNYSREDLQKVFRQNEFQILDDNFDYFFCYEGNRERYPQANMIALASQKGGDILLGKGSVFFQERLDDLRSIPESQRTASRLQEGLGIDSQYGDCIKVS